ncbi:MAG: hypothetical protein L0H64_15660 [Pseudonocardia sp.]|nr:hypothetical protein [Pseudonocardia sp.]
MGRRGRMAAGAMLGAGVMIVGLVTVAAPAAAAPPETVTLTMLDSTGAPLSGGTASYYSRGWHNVPGATDAQGHLAVELPADVSQRYLSIAMEHEGTRDQQSYPELTASNYTFRTALATVKLVDADGTALDAGTHVAYYARGWHPVGSGTTSGGQVTQEMFPGSYSFEMTYNNSRQQQNRQVVESPGSDVVFQTGALTVNYSGGVGYYYRGWHAFNKPTEQFLPGTRTFYPDNQTDCAVEIPIAAGDHLVKSIVKATLVDSNGQSLAGGEAQAYVGGWKPLGTTNDRGRACAVYDGSGNHISVGMVYNGTRTQIGPGQAEVYAFQTEAVTVELRDSANALIADGGQPSYYAGRWHNLGPTAGGSTTVQMLPGSYSFAMTYQGTREQKDDVGIADTGPTTVTFRTGPVHSDSAAAKSYYAGGWRPFTQDMELLPNRSVPFAFTDGTPQTSFDVIGNAATTHIH